MVTGKRHAAAGRAGILAGSTLAVALQFGLGLGWGPVAAAIAGLVAGYVVTPDIDMSESTVEERRVRHVPIIGWLVGPVWRALWWPYAWVLPHRSKLSHAPLISTLGRMVYVAGIVTMVRLLVAVIVGQGVTYGHLLTVIWSYSLSNLVTLLWPWSLGSLAALYVGWAAQDVVHWVMDW